MKDRNRRLAGLGIGMIFGLLYSVVAEFINVWALPDVPLYELPIDRVEIVILSALAVGVSGMIVAWNDESFWGLIFAILWQVVASSVLAYINSAEWQMLKSIIVFVFTFMPRSVMYLPLGLFFYWLINKIDEVIRYGRGRQRSIAVTIVALIAVPILGGLLSLYPPEARRALQDANTLLIEAMSVEDLEALPSELQRVDGFIEYASGPYTLEWSSDVNRLPVLRPSASLGTIESLILYRFENGFIFGCVFTPPSYKASCANISRVPPR